jgi:hypothetical protein
MEVGIKEHGSADAQEFLDEDPDRVLLLLLPPGPYRVHPRALLRYSPLRSSGENLAGWAVRVGLPQEGQRRRKV